MKKLFTLSIVLIPFLINAQLLNEEIRYEVILAEMYSEAGGDPLSDNEYSMLFTVGSQQFGLQPEHCYSFEASSSGSSAGSSNPIAQIYDADYDDYFSVYLSAWEDDGGERCDYDSGDDNLYIGFATIHNTCITCQPEGPTAWMQGIGYQGAGNWVGDALTPSTSDWNFRLDAIWRYDGGDFLSRPLNFGEIADAGLKFHTNNNRTVSLNNDYDFQYRDNVHEPSPEVYYSFEINDASSSNVTITTDFDETNFDTKIYLLDNDNNEIASNDDIVPGGENLKSEINIDLCAGRYKVMVEGYDNNKGTFKLGVTATSLPLLDGTIYINSTCPNQETGGIRIGGLTGGIAPYNITWSDAGTILDDTTLIYLGGGIYPILISDDCGYTISQDISISDVDETAPIAFCAPDTVTVVLSPGEIFNLNAQDFDYGSYDNCSGNLAFDMFPFEVSASNSGLNAYELQVTDESGNTGSCLGVIFVEVSTAVSQDAVLDKAFSVYPNPTADIATIDIKGINIDNGLITLRDMEGKLIREETVNTTSNWSTAMDLSNLATGVYTLQLTSNGHQLTRKVVKY